MVRSIMRVARAVIVMLALGSAVRANNDTWKIATPPPAGAIWGVGSNWTDTSTPGGNDQATFLISGSSLVTFDANPVAIQDLFVQAGNVTFASSGGTRTLNLNSASGGQDVVISDGASLSVGGTNLTAGDNLNVQLGGTLNANTGSHINSMDLFLSWVGTAVVADAGSSLNASASATIGTVTGTSTLTYRVSATGSLAPAGTVDVGVSGSGTVGILNVESGAAVELGNLNVGTGSASTGTINVNSAGSTLTQVGAGTMTVGSASGGVGTINVGTTNSGGTVTSGTGLLTINKTGTVNIGSGSTTGALFAMGNVTIDRGVLQRNSGSTFALAAGKTMTIQNGGRASFAGSFVATVPLNYSITGANSKLETTGDGTAFLDFSSGALVTVTSGGMVSSAGSLSVGDLGLPSERDGTLSVDGSGTSAVALGGVWGYNGGTATITISNGATGTFSGVIQMAGSSDTTTGSTANVNVTSGAQLSATNLIIANFGGATKSGTLNVNGSGSAVTLTGASTSIIGSGSTGTAAINIGTTATGGTFTTGTGATGILKTGTVTIGSGANTGTLNANGDVSIQGGRLQVGPGSSVIVASGKTVTLTSSGMLQGSGSVVGNVVNTSGVVAPGASPGVLTMSGNYTQSAGGQLAIELGGTAVGSYDKLVVGGLATLDGTLQVLLINGLSPSLGNTFDILDWGTHSGAFPSIQFPSLGSTLAWSTYRLYTAGVLSVVDINLQSGDFNRDHQVTAADIPAMLAALADLNAYKTARALTNADLLSIGDIDGSGALTNADMQALLNLLKSGGGSLAAVPEPASIVLLTLALPGLVLTIARSRGSSLRYGMSRYQ